MPARFLDDFVDIAVIVESSLLQVLDEVRGQIDEELLATVPSLARGGATALRITALRLYHADQIAG